MELIKNKIVENVERRKMLLKLCKQIVEQDGIQSELAIKEKNIAVNICKGLISKKVITTIKVKEVIADAYRGEDKLAINNLGIGNQPHYGTMMNVYSSHDLIDVLKHARLLVPFVKTKSAKTRLELFEDALKNYEIISQHEIELDIEQSDYDSSKSKDNPTKTTLFNVDNPANVKTNGSYGGSSIDINYLSQYTMIEQHYDALKKAYEEVLKKMKSNNEKLKTVLEDTTEKLGPWLLIKEL